MALGGSLAGLARVELRVDDNQFHRDFRRDQETFRRGTNEMQRDAGRLSRGVLAGSGAFRSLGRSIAFASGSFLGGVGFAAVVRSSIGVASDLNEQINKTRVVFGDSGKDIVAWSRTTANSLGIARNEALGFAATFGNLLVPMGYTREEAAAMSKRLVQLAADLASFNNASPEEALQALRSALVGEQEPLRRFGVFISEARVQAEALSTGIAKTTKSTVEIRQANERLAIAEAKLIDTRRKYGANTTQVAQAQLQYEKAQQAVNKAVQGHTVQLNDQQKAQARYNIILRDSTDAQGDFSRTSGGLANQQRILRANLKDLEGQIGTALLPTVLNLTRRLNDWIQHAQKTGEIQRDVNSAVRIGTAFFRGLSGVIRAITPVVRTVNSALGGTENTFKLIFAIAAISKFRSIAGGIGLIGTAAGDAGGAKGLGGMLTRLRLLTRSPWVIGLTIAVSIIGADKLGDALAKRLGLQGRGFAGLGDDVAGGAGDLKPVLRGGVWVDPISGKPVPNQGYWDDQARRGNVTSPRRLRRGGQAIPDTSQSAPRQRGIAGSAVRYAREPEAGSASYAIPGGRRPQGFQDCSSFTQAVYRQNGISIGGNTVSQWNGAPRKGKNMKDAIPGDLLFYYYHNGTSAAPDHVGIYIGGGKQVEDHGSRSGVTIGNAGGRGFWGWGRYTKSGRTKPADADRGGGFTGGDEPSAGLVVGQPRRKRTPPVITGEELLPDPIQLRLERARATGGPGDDLKALDAGIDYVERQLKRHDLSKKKRLEFTRLLGRLRREREREQKEWDRLHPGGEALLPKRIRTRLKATRGDLEAPQPGEEDKTDEQRYDEAVDKELAALDGAIAFVRKQLRKKNLGDQKRRQLNRLLRALQSERATVQARRPTAAFTGATGAFESYQGGYTRQTRRIPGLGTVNVQIPNEQPQDVAGWKKIQAQIVAAAKKIQARLTKLRKQLARLTRALRKAMRARRRNPQLLTRLRQQIANIRAEISELQRELGFLRDDWGTAEEAIAALEGERGGAGNIPPELEEEFARGELAIARGDVAGGEALELDALRKEQQFLESQLAGATTPQRRAELQQALSSVLTQITSLQQSREARIVELPDSIRLALAQATLTGTTGDDLAALGAAEQYYSRVLQTPGLSVDAKINLINALRGVRDEINNIKQQSTALQELGLNSVLSFLSNLRGLREFQSNIYNPLDYLSGTSVSITNNFQEPPPDPHLWSAGVSFDLQAMT